MAAIIHSARERQRLAVVAAAAVAAAVAMAACGPLGGGGPVAGDQAQTLTIYSSLPVQGDDTARQEAIVNGEKLALAEAGGHVGPFHVSFASLTDADRQAGAATAADTLAAARTASSDRSTIAYVGDFDSPATAISLPLLNEGGILQVSPASTYVGLTDAAPTAGPGEPERFYPSAGPRTFARLAPSDAVEARALVGYARRLGVRRLFVIGDHGVFDADVALIAASVARAGGLAVVGPTLVDFLSPRPSDYRRLAATAAAARADGVIVGATDGAGVRALWLALHAALPRAKLFAASSLATPAFAAAVGRGGAGPATYVTSPVLEARAYPASAQAVLQRYRAAFGIEPTPYALYGYEAMKSILDAIRAAGSHGGDRAHVVRAYFRAAPRDSVLGRYAVTPTGDTTLANMGGDRVGPDGRLHFDRMLTGAG